MALQLVQSGHNTPPEAAVSNDCPSAECLDQLVGPPALEYLVDRVLIALRDNGGIPLRVVLEDALRELHPGAPVFLRDVIPPTTRPAGFVTDVPGSTWRLHVGQTPLPDAHRALLRAATAFAAIVAELDRRQAPRADRRPPEAEIIGTSAAIQGVRDRIARVAETDFTVLVEGESGVGKELVARRIHEQSRRHHGPFVAVNCAAIVETLVEAELFGIEDRTATGVRGRRGKFEQAEGGTLFLDEVSDLSPAAQAKLLRAIQDLAIERVGGHVSRAVDTRIIVATNRSLSGLVGDGRFRADLYYRLNGVEVLVPPLRARREDIPLLVEHFLERYRSVRRIRPSRSAMDALMAYEWPGNVRQLERVIERAVTLTEDVIIDVADLPPIVSGENARMAIAAASANESMRMWGSRYARLVLDRCHGNKRKACHMLGISYHTLEGHLRFTGERRKRELKEKGGHAPGR